MLKSQKLRKSLIMSLVVLLAAGTPVHANLLQKVGKWIKAHKAELATIGGVVMSIVNPELAPVGAALVTLQGSMAKTSAILAADPNLARNFSAPRFCEDGGLSCPAAQGLLHMEVPPIEIGEAEKPEVAAFLRAVNRVAEEGNVFAKHCQENASLEVKNQDLQVMASSVAAAADAYDRLNVSLELSQADIDSFQKQTQGSGLPRIEQAFWQNAGLSPAEVEDVARFLGTEDLRMPAPAVSMSDVLHTAAAAFVPSFR
jgi:hypothetical protein